MTNSQLGCTEFFYNKSEENVKSKLSALNQNSRKYESNLCKFQYSIIISIECWGEFTIQCIKEQLIRKKQPVHSKLGGYLFHCFSTSEKALSQQTGIFK